MILPAATRLAIQPAADLPLPIRWAAPFRTVTFHITKTLLVIYVEPRCNPLDWDIAAALMARIAARPRVPSMLSHLREWTVELVECAADWLTRLSL